MKSKKLFAFMLILISILIIMFTKTKSNISLSYLTNSSEDIRGDVWCGSILYDSFTVGSNQYETFFLPYIESTITDVTKSSSDWSSSLRFSQHVRVNGHKINNMHTPYRIKNVKGSICAGNHTEFTRYFINDTYKSLVRGVEDNFHTINHNFSSDSGHNKVRPSFSLGGFTTSSSDYTGNATAYVHWEFDIYKNDDFVVSYNESQEISYSISN